MTDLLTHLQSLIEPTGIEVGLAAAHLPSGATVALNAETLFPLASVVKVPLMVAVLRAVEAGECALSDRITLTDEAKILPSGILLRFEPGLQPTVRDLLTLMTIISDNTATDMLFALVGGPAGVAATMAALGFPDIHVALTMREMYRRGYGLPADPTPTLADFVAADERGHMARDSVVHACTPENNVASAAAVTRLMAALGHGRLVSPAACATMRAILAQQQYNDAIPRLLPRAVRVAHKTGSIHRIRNDAALITAPDGAELALTILTRHYTPTEGDEATEAERDSATALLMARLARAVYDAFCG